MKWSSCRLGDKMTMKLLVATQKQLILWDGKQHTILESHGMFYGISWNYDTIFAVERVTEEPSAVLALDENLHLLGYMEFSELGDDPHQAFWYKDCLYIANRDKFRVEVMETSTGKQWHVHQTEKDNHINSVWSDGEYFYVVEHRQNRMPKAVQLFDMQWNHHSKLEVCLKEQTPHTGYGIHNVYKEDSMVVTLAPDQFVLMHMSWKEHLSMAFAHTIKGPVTRPYYRGLAKAMGVFYVGVSRVDAREHRGEGDSCIYMLDNRLDLLDVIELHDTGQILEVRALTGDLAHNGLDCPYVRTTKPLI